MLKFLRKYNKMLLVVAGSVLMVLFLLPQAVQQLGPNPLNEVAFRINDRAYRGKDVVAAQARFGIIAGLERVAGAPLLYGMQLQKGAEIEHWMLLVHEARTHGLVGGGGGSEDMIALLADLRAQQVQMFGGTPEQIAQTQAEVRSAVYGMLAATLDDLRKQYGEDTVAEAVAQGYGVRRLLELYGGFSTISTPEAAMVAVRALDTAVADMGQVDVTETIRDVGTPTAEQLQAHFDQYRDLFPADSPDGIGYRQEDAVLLDAVEVDLSQIRTALVIDDIEVNKRWRQNKATYGENFAAVKPVVESDLRDERLAEVVRALEEIGRRELRKETADLPADGAFKALPADWIQKQADFERLTALLNAEAARLVPGVEAPAKLARINGWQTRRDLNARAMGRASTTIRAQAYALPDLALSVREIDPQTRTGMQVGVAFGPLLMPRERLVFFRVTEARPSGPPAALDEVKMLAELNWKNLRARELLFERIEEIRRTVVEAGTMEVLITEFDRPQVQLGVEVTRTGARLPGGAPATAAVTPEMCAAIMDRVNTWDPSVPVSSLPMDQRVIARTLDSSFAVGIALVRGRYPVTDEAMRSAIAPLSQQYAAELYSESPTVAPFDFAPLSERLGYTIPESRARSDEDDAAGESDAAEPVSS